MSYTETNRDPERRSKMRLYPPHNTDPIPLSFTICLSANYYSVKVSAMEIYVSSNDTIKDTFWNTTVLFLSRTYIHYVEAIH